MSANLPPVPTAGSDPMLPVPSNGYPSNGYAMQQYDPNAYPPAAEAPAEGGASIGRVVSTLARFRWLIIVLAIVGLGVGIAVGRVLEPTYEVVASVFATPEIANRNPTSTGSLTENNGWKDLLRSFAIVDPVVRDLALYMKPEKASDSLLFANFRVKDQFRPGQYTLKFDRGRYSLVDKLSLTNEAGTLGDSVGRTAGFAWVPPSRLIGTGSRTVEFKVITPREASRNVLTRFIVNLQPNSPVINLVMTGTAADRPAATLNAMLGRFVEVSAELKKRELVQQTTTLSEQLQAAKERLEGSERALESYRVATIAKPSETPTVILPGQQQGVEVSQPVFGAYYARRAEAETIKRDRIALEKLAAQINAPNSTVPPEGILSIPTVRTDEGALSVRQAIGEITAAEVQLRKDLQLLTDSNNVIKDQRRSLNDLRRRVLPQRLSDYIAALKDRETEVTRVLSDATTELQEIPQRTIAQGALERERNVQAQIYTALRSAYAQANLAQQSAVPDVKILDSAVTPSQPTGSTQTRMIGFGLVGGLALGVVLAIMLDRMDSRFRYPDQAKTELGLHVLGAVPVVDQSGRQSPEAVAQIVEAFRSLRMNIRYASGGQRNIAFGITSPGAGDGKSLVASNLALSFAEGGWRTLLIDADTRRGQLNVTFDAPNAPGLVEYLEGTSLLSEVVYPSRHDNLSIVPCGTRHRRAPELLATPRMQQLIATLSADFDVVIIDTPPLGAGTDAYAIGTACGQLAVVLRNNRTNLKMAKAKLSVVSQLPVTILGAILNEVRTDSGVYQYYSYDSEYVLAEESPALEAGAGTAVAVRER